MTVFTLLTLIVMAFYHWLALAHIRDLQRKVADLKLDTGEIGENMTFHDRELRRRITALETELEKRKVLPEDWEIEWQEHWEALDERNKLTDAR